MIETVCDECASFCNLIPLVSHLNGKLLLQKEMHNILYLLNNLTSNLNSQIQVECVFFSRNETNQEIS